MSSVPSPERRALLARGMAVGLGALASRAALAQADDAEPANALERRPYGETGEELSIIGLGGIVVSGIEQREANEIVARAVDRGVNYFDVAPTYGNAQERLGPALEPYRDDSFLACKTTQRKAVEARAELEESLRLLRTDHVDLYQLHGLANDEEVDVVFGPGGAMEAFVEARDKGLVRYIGFSAHSVSAALKALDAFEFDSVLFPFNAVCIENGGFGPRVVAKAEERGAARLALKAMAWTPAPAEHERRYAKCWYQPIDDRDLAYLALRYTLDLPITAAIPPGDEGLFEMAVDLGLRYRPLEDAERETLLTALDGVAPIFATA